MTREGGRGQGTSNKAEQRAGRLTIVTVYAMRLYHNWKQGYREPGLREDEKMGGWGRNHLGEGYGRYGWRWESESGLEEMKEAATVSLRSSRFLVGGMYVCDVALLG